MRKKFFQKIILNKQNSIKDAIQNLAMSGLQICLVCEGTKLLGTITDGDIRRAIDNSNYFFDMSAQDIMTEGFLSVTPDDLASECLNIMAEKKIGCLAVMENDLLVGLVNQKDLVKLGI